MGEPGVAPRGGDFAGELEEHLVAQFGVENSLRFGETCAEIVEKLPTGKLFLIRDHAEQFCDALKNLKTHRIQATSTMSLAMQRLIIWWAMPWVRQCW